MTVFECGALNSLQRTCDYMGLKVEVRDRRFKVLPATKGPELFEGDFLQTAKFLKDYSLIRTQSYAK